MMKKTKIVLEERDTTISKARYRVVALVNRTLPSIGTGLTREEVDLLIRESENLTVEIKKGKR